MGSPETHMVTTTAGVRARRPEDFPPEVHGSLAALRAVAKQAKSRTDPGVRWATDDELALALILQKPWMCTGRSSRTGLPCERPRLAGATVCRTHGAGTKVAKAAATRRLDAMVMPMLSRQKTLALQTDNLTVAQKATSDLLDRAGVGAVVEAKIRQSHKQEGLTVFAQKNHLHIGFLAPAPGAPAFTEDAKTVLWHDGAAFNQYQATQKALADAEAAQEADAIDIIPGESN